MPPEEIVRVEDVTHSFGGVTAVDHCSWSVKRHSATALIGPNGAGKSTLLALIAGALPHQKGRVYIDDGDVTGWAPHRIAMRGAIRTFQITRDFSQMTVTENMMVAPRRQIGESLWRVLFTPGACRAEARQLADRAMELLDSFDLYDVRNHYASELSGGQRRLLEVARAVMCDPTLLILDEPMAGVNPRLADRICQHLLDLRDTGVTLLIVEHNLTLVERMCDSVTVMVRGRPIATGRMDELRQDQAVVDAYLGRA